jgi:hypothetical protein
MLHRQGYHLAVYLLLGAALYLASSRLPGHEGGPWGLGPRGWLTLSWLMAGVHQGWIAAFWRMALYSDKAAWTSDTAFVVFRVGFVTSAAVRFLALIPISQSTAHTLGLPALLSIGLLVVTTPFILWGLYSVVAYFGITRSFGADHFDPAHRGGRLEKRGLFKYVPNSMYTVILLALYHPGLLFHSGIGLLAATAHHVLVWCHYFCTEKPDMREIYGPS